MIALSLISAPLGIQCLMLCYIVNTIFVLGVSMFWKISIHAVGVSSPAVATSFVLGYYGIITLLLIPVVIWSRVHLKKHTPAQVVAGALSALTITTFIFWALI